MSDGRLSPKAQGKDAHSHNDLAYGATNCQHTIEVAVLASPDRAENALAYTVAV
jgi:hypothetical protein